MARTTIRTEDITASEVTTAKMAVDPTNASNLSSGDVPLAQLGNAPEYDDSGVQDDIALLGFKVAANGSLAKYNLVDQTVDDFQDASGVDASASTGEDRDSTGKYYRGGTTVSPTATGGTVTTSGIYTFHHFTSSGDFVTDTAQDMDVLLIAGGGGGGRHPGGGGGAGGLVYQTGRTITAATHAYVQGSGGAGHNTGNYPSDGGGNGAPGVDSTWNSLTAKGGGFGGWQQDSGGGDGGSGGGAARNVGSAGSTNQSSQPGDSGTYGFGYNGGASNVSGSPYPAAGGGGAGAAGSDSTSTSAGAGGVGKQIAIFDGFGTNSSNAASSGDYFAGGGGGHCQENDNQGAGGAGGGGRGAEDNTDNTGMGVNGLANTGGGGGGNFYNGASGPRNGNGGSGTLIIRRLTSSSTYANMTLVSNATTAETQPTKADLVMTYTNGSGTATIGTDLTAEVSRDNGTTYTSFGLSASSVQGTTGGHTILTAHDVDISSQPAGTSMRYRIKTLNQVEAKSTRIHAVSLGWS